MFSFPAPPKRRKPSLTPMIDVVFLLLVFFMLASQFGRDTAVPITTASGAGSYSGAPRLVSIGPNELRLNGHAMPLSAVSQTLRALVETPEDIVVLRAESDTTLQRLIDVAQALRHAGFAHLAVVE